MMAKDPAHRYQTGRELFKDIVRLRETLNGPSTMAIAAAELSGEDVLPTTSGGLATLAVSSAGGSRSASAVPPPLHLRRWLLIAFIGSLLLAAGGGVGYAWYRRQAANTVPPTTDPGPDDPNAIQLVSSVTKEQALKMLVEESLSQASAGKGAPTRFDACLEL